MKKADKDLGNERIDRLAESLQVQLHGMGLDFKGPPITIAGVLIHDHKRGLSNYRGGVIIGFPSYTPTATVEYDQVSFPENYKYVFTFAKPDGLLVEVSL